MDGTGANVALSGFTVLLHNLLEFFMLVVFRDSTVLRVDSAAPLAFVFP